MDKKFFTDYLSEHMEKNPEHVVFRFLNYREETDDWEFQDITFRMLGRKALEMAYALKKQGVGRGDRVIIFSMQDFNTIFSVYGCILAGAVFTILPPPLDEGKIQRFISVLKSCKPKALISNYAMEQEAGVKLTGRVAREALSSALRMRRIYSDRLTPYSGTDVITPAGPEDLVYLQYTSGSTSSPKGVMVKRKTIMNQMNQYKTLHNFDHATLGTWVPFFHNLGLAITILMPTCVEAGTVYYLNTLQFLSNPKLWVRMLSEFKIGMTVGPESAYDACTRIFSPAEAAKYDLSHMTHLMNGSEAVNHAMMVRFAEMFGCDINAIAPGYGVSEACCLASVAWSDYRHVGLDREAFQKNRVILSDAPDAREIVSVGLPVDGLSFVIGNPKSGKVYDELHIGEIFMRGPNIADGYWGGISANKNFRYRMNGYDCDFYATGDLGFLYEGRLYITGRIKEMMIVNGHNIYPADLAAMVKEKVPHLAYAPMAFISITVNEREQIAAIIESSSEEDFEKLIGQLNSAAFELFGFSFADIVFVAANSLPRTDNSKLQLVKAKALYESGQLKAFYSSRQDRKVAGSDTLISKSIDMADDVLVQVRSIFERVLNLDQYSLSDSFLDLGGDSLKGFELISKMEESFHIKLNLQELLMDSSVLGVTRYIKRVMNGGALRAARVDLSKECVLDPAIRYEQPYDIPVSGCSKILLTGATGFLGGHLIQSLIRTYPKEDLEIYCLVRSETVETAKERIIQNMKHYQCWEDSYESYIFPVLGDLSSSRLGMDKQVYEYLSNHVQMIIHNGAVLNFAFPYQFLKATNVNGTVETLRFAAAGRAKYYHYVSSYSVYDTPNNLGKLVREDDPLKTYKGFALAYSETKWVSEKLVGIARKRGLQAVIYRPGDITGSSAGIWKVEDMVSRMIVSIIRMKAIPFTRYQFHWTPVDYVAQAIAVISRKEEAIGQAFNVINPETLPMPSLVSMIRRCGYTVRYIPFTIWRNRLRHADVSSNPLAMLSFLFESETNGQATMLRHFVGKDTTYDTSNTRLLLNGTGVTCPPIGPKLVAAYLRNFEAQGFIDPQ